MNMNNVDDSKAYSCTKPLVRSRSIFCMLFLSSWGELFNISVMFGVWFMLRVSFLRPWPMFMLFFLFPLWFPWPRPWTMWLWPWMCWLFFAPWTRSLSLLVSASWPWPFSRPLFAPWPMTHLLFSTSGAVTSFGSFLSPALSFQLPSKIIPWGPGSSPGGGVSVWTPSSVRWPCPFSPWRSPRWSGPSSSWRSWSSPWWWSILWTSVFWRSTKYE